jgi:hypothetical protein
MDSLNDLEGKWSDLSSFGLAVVVVDGEQRKEWGNRGSADVGLGWAVCSYLYRSELWARGPGPGDDLGLGWTGWQVEPRCSGAGPHCYRQGTRGGPRTRLR